MSDLAYELLLRDFEFVQAENAQLRAKVRDAILTLSEHDHHPELIALSKRLEEKSEYTSNNED